MAREVDNALTRSYQGVKGEQKPILKPENTGSTYTEIDKENSTSTVYIWNETEWVKL